MSARRRLHAGAWWLWALGLATAAARTTNPLLLLLVVAVTGTVVAVCRSDDPWAGSYAVFLRIGLLVIAIRVVFGAVLAAPAPGRTLVTLPSVALPSWLAGIRLGGPVTAEGLTVAGYDALRLATVLVCVGAANALAAPSRLLKSVPGALYEIGVAVVVAMTFAPQAVAHVRRVRAARRLRGRSDRGLRALGAVAVPVLEGSLERSVALAAAMDARGYGRTAAVRPGVRRATAALILGGLLAVCAGLYGLLDAQAPAGLGSPPLLAGLASAVTGLWLGGRRSPRTRYRPDPWRLREWAVTGCGVLAAAAVTGAGLAGWGPAGAGLHPAPGALPGLPPLPAAGLLAALGPVLVAGGREGRKGRGRGGGTGPRTARPGGAA